MAAVRRPLSLFRLGIVAALLLSGCSALPSIAGAPRFQADTLVGADTWSFTDITLRPSLQQALRMKDVMDLLAGPTADAGADLHHLPTPSGRMVDVEQDVLPHLDGEVSVALSGSVDDPDFVVLAHTNDVDGILRLLAEEPQPTLARDARGVTRYEPSSGEVFVGGYKNWIIYTLRRDLREQTIDRIDGKGSASLASEPRYRSVVDRLNGDRLGFGYLDVTPLLDGAALEDLNLADTFQSRGRMAYSLGFDQGPAAGVNALGVGLEYIPDAPVTTPVPRIGDALQAMDQLPKASMLAFAGPDLSVYPSSLASLDDNPELNADLQSLLGTFAGPWAASVTRPVAKPRGFDASPFSDSLNDLIGGFFVVARIAPDADVDQISGAIDDAFDAAAQSDEDAAGWQHQVVADNDWLAINAVPPTTALANVPQDLLAADQVYQWVRRGFSQNGTNVYINLAAIEQAFGSGLLSGDDLAVLTRFPAMGISSEMEPRGDVHARVTVLIGGG
jgi:hypothetical protein